MNTTQRTTSNEPDTRLLVPVLLTPEQAAQSLGIGRTAVYALIREGQLPSVKLGRSRRVPYAALVSFVERLQTIALDPSS